MPTHTIEQFSAARITGKPTDPHVIDAWFQAGCDETGPSGDGEKATTVYLYPVSYRWDDGDALTTYYSILETAGRFEYCWICVTEHAPSLEEAEKALYEFLLDEGCFETPEERLRAQYRNSEYAGVAA
jgi:hypothetical protein